MQDPAGGFYTSQDADLQRPGQPPVLGADYYAKDDPSRRALGIPRIDTAIYADLNGRMIVTHVTPGRRPVQALVSALARGLDLGEDSLLTSIRAEPEALERALRRQQGDIRGRIIFVDQLEELVTLATPEDAALAARIIARLAAGIDGVRVLATARGDFLTRIAQLPGLGDELARALYFLLPLGRAGIHRAVVGPAELKGVRFESEAIVEQLVQAGLDGSLPLLQFALAEIWEARDQAHDTITAADLDKLGGISGALARHADGVLARLSPAQRRAAHTLLLHLVTLESTRATLGHEELVGDDPEARRAEAELEGTALTGDAAANVPARLPPLPRRGWWFMFGAFALASTGGVFAGLTEVQEDKAERLTITLDSSTGAALVYADIKDEYEHTLRVGRRDAALAKGFLAAGGGFLIAGITFFIVHATRGRKAASKAKAQLRPTGGGLEVRF